MKNKIVYLLLLALIIVAGCSVEKGEQKDQMENKNQDQEARQSREEMEKRISEAFDQISFADLTIGQQVLVMGEQASDGSVTADRIMVGNGEIDFGEFNQGMRMVPNSNMEDVNNSDGANIRERPEGMPDFKNMSEEDRMKLREERMTNGGGMPYRNLKTSGSGEQTVRIEGEILDKDEESITLKTENGSKFIFFTEDTIFLKVK